MKYSQFIQPNTGFQYSINLQYDLDNIHKVQGYIPTQYTVQILKEYLMSIYYDTEDKATVLIGPYGKGKSHLLLVLLTIICDLGIENKQVIEGLVANIQKIDSTCAQLINEIAINKKFMPIIINSNTKDLNQAFLIGLKEALDKIKLTNLLPETYFDSALETINMWKLKYKDSYQVLKQELIKKQTNIEELKKGLKLYRKKEFEIFKDIYPIITSGIEFNPLINTDVAKLYTQVNHIICEQYGYGGIFIVFDEFSKFLEASIDYNTARDMKLLQDIAEIANRSESKQLHLVCVTHKAVNEYIKKLPEEKINAWRGIEGRFKNILFNTTSQQTYDLISNSIIKDEVKFNKLLGNKLYKEFISSMPDGYDLFKDSYSFEEYEQKIVKGCFPLSPYATFALPRISEKIAQNERTLFTFLCKNERHSFLEFIAQNKGDIEVLTVDKIYDYFEELFKKEVFNEKIHQIWLKVNAALKYCTNTIEIKVIKSLGIVYILNDFNQISPMRHNLTSLLNFSRDEVDCVIENLLQKNIIILRKNSAYIDFFPLNGINIKKKINDYINTNVKNFSVSQEIKEIVKEGFVLPKRYNNEYRMTRFFKIAYLTANEFMAYGNSQTLLNEYQADGVVVNLIYFTKQELWETIEHYQKLNSKRILLMIPINAFEKMDELKKYIAINSLKKDKEFLKEDISIKDQLDIMEEDVRENLNQYLDETYSIGYAKSTLMDLEGECQVYKLSDLNNKVSLICSEIFTDTPVINNELMNKHNITTQMLNARNKIVDSILTNEYINFEDTVKGPERTIFRATVRNKGLIKSSQCDQDIEKVLDIIREFLVSTEKKEKNMQQLYDGLLGEKYKIGIRRGVIPIYIAYVLKDYLDEVIIYLEGRKKKELPIDVNTINNINNSPSEYSLRIEKGTKEKEQYIEKLRNIFENYIDKGMYQKNRYIELLKGMQKYIQSLSKFSRTHTYNFVLNKNVEEYVQEFRKQTIKFDINPREFLFYDLIEITRANNLQECAEKIYEIKKYLDLFDKNIKGYLAIQTKDLFLKSYKGSLAQAFKIWRSKLSEFQKEYLYDTTTNDILQLIENHNNDDESMINSIAYTVTGLNVEDWNDNHIEDYLNELRKIKDTVEDYKEELKHIEQENLIKIGFVDNQGNETEKAFVKSEVTPLGKSLYNGIDDLLEEFADSISDNEKRSVIIRILEKYI